MSSSSYLRTIVSENRRSEPRAIPSYCTAHPDVLKAIFRTYQNEPVPVLIEATCNQVNQHGGYTGMTPIEFRDFVAALASDLGFPTDRIILGGDHLGPNPWRQEPAHAAMAKARDMIRAYASGGFTKIHLDASTACADDVSLGEDEIARRAAELCEAAENAPGANELLFVVGSEVPAPGGELNAAGVTGVTSPAAVERTMDLHREAFRARGLDAAFDKVVAIVVQPGVDFGNSDILRFDRSKAAGLSAAIDRIPGIAFEAHSTDYQTSHALSELVASHFAIIKVGPELTSAYREAVVAMAHIEQWLPCRRRSNVLSVIRNTMDRDPRHWVEYVAADEHVESMRMFGLSDRVRYYWPYPEIRDAVSSLRRNIDESAPDRGLVAQYVRELELLPDTSGLSNSEAIIQATVGAVARKYRGACRDRAMYQAPECDSDSSGSLTALQGS